MDLFIGSVDASSEVANANMLADLLEQQIEKVDKEYVVQVVTDNGAKFQGSGKNPYGQDPNPILDTMCSTLFGFDVGRYWEDKGV